MRDIDKLFKLAAEVILAEEERRPDQLSYLEGELVSSLAFDTGWPVSKARDYLSKHTAWCAIEKRSRSTFDLHRQCLAEAKNLAANRCTKPSRIARHTDRLKMHHDYEDSSHGRLNNPVQ